MTDRSKTYAFQPDYGASPGESLAEVLEDRGMSQAELARRTGLSAKHVNQVILGEASISPEVGLRLEKVLQVPSRFWTTLDAQYRDYRIRQEESVALEADIPWLDELPIAELVNRGYVRPRVSEVEVVRDVLAFFGVANRQAWRNVWTIPTAYRKSRVHDVKEPALAAWIRIGELKASDVKTNSFDRKAFRDLLPQLRALTLLQVDQWHPQLIKMCAEAGVAVVFEPEIKGSRISGVTRWIESDVALIEMSLRGKWADIFWFSFFHEVAHVLLHDRKRLTFVDGPPAKNEADDLETEANLFSSRTLIPAEYENALSVLRTKADVLDFASGIGIHPGIVVGRLQHDGHLKFNQLNELRNRYTFA